MPEPISEPTDTIEATGRFIPPAEPPDDLADLVADASVVVDDDNDEEDD